MNEPLTLVLAALAGCGLGALFCGGLWWTVRKGLSSKRPALWFLGSLVLRTGGVLVGFYLISDGRWKRLLACFLGFVVARLVATFPARAGLRRRAAPAQTEPERFAKPQAERPTNPENGGSPCA